MQQVGKVEVYHIRRLRKRSTVLVVVIFFMATCLYDKHMHTQLEVELIIKNNFSKIQLH